MHLLPIERIGEWSILHAARRAALPARRIGLFSSLFGGGRRRPRWRGWPRRPEMPARSIELSSGSGWRHWFRSAFHRSTVCAYTLESRAAITPVAVGGTCERGLMASSAGREEGPVPISDRSDRSLIELLPRRSRRAPSNRRHRQGRCRPGERRVGHGPGRRGCPARCRPDSGPEFVVHDSGLGGRAAERAIHELVDLSSNGPADR